MDYFTVIFRFSSLCLVLIPILYLIFFKRIRSNSYFFFLGFLITFPGPIVHQIITHSYLWEKYPRLFYLPFNFFFFTVPFFTLYIRSHFQEVNNKKQIVYLCLLGILEFFFMLTMFCLPTRISIYGFAMTNKLFFPILFGVILPTFSLLLIFFTFRKVHVFYLNHAQNLSNKQKSHLKWIKYMCIVLALNYTFMFSTLFLHDTWVELIDSLITIFCVYFISIYSIREFHVHSPFPIFERRTLNTEDDAHFNKIKIVLENEKIYVNPSLNVEDLAALVALHPKKVSYLINVYAGSNFNQFINKYRIEESKRLLLDRKYNNITIQGIAKESGFNSRSVFNQVFKSEIGLTPSDFKNNNSEKASTSS